MSRYVLVIIETEASRRFIQADRALHRERIEAWMATQAGAGVLVGGEAFETEAERPVLVRRDVDGTPNVSEGAFGCDGETLGGYVLVEVADRGAAVDLARTWPTQETLEVRPLWVAPEA